jgi:integrase
MDKTDVYLWERNGTWYYRSPEKKTFHSTGIKVEPRRKNRNRDQALVWALKKLGKGEEQQVPTLEEYTIDFFVWGRCSWIRRQHAKGRSFSQGVAKNRRAYLKNHLIPAFGDIRLDQFNPVEIEDWLIHLELSNQTKNHILDTLNIILREAKREKVIATHPLADVERMANTFRKRDPLTLEECLLLFPRKKSELMQVWKQERGQPSTTAKWATLFYLMLTSGVRVGEVAALRWKHIIWETPAILLVEQAVKSDGEIGPPKSGDVRAVFLPKRTKDMLAWWREQSPFTKADDFVFFGEGPDKHLNRKTISKKFPPALKAAGIGAGDRYITAHSLRHTYNSQMRKVLPEGLLQYMMGHKSRSMTERYTNLLPADRLRQYLPAPPDLDSTWR